MFVTSSSLMPKIAPTANTPAAILNTASKVRILLCHKSNQTLYQITPMLNLPCSELDILLFVLIRGLVQALERDFRRTQHFVELIVFDCQHFHGTALRGTDRGITLTMMEECDLAKVLTRTQLENNHIGLIKTWQDY